MKKSWLDEIARDVVALGGIPFLIITIARVSVMEPYYPMQFIIGSLVFLALRAVFKAEIHAGVGLILVVFTSIFYKSLLFFIFALVIYAGIISSLVYFKESNRAIAKGIFFGLIGAATGYILVRTAYF